MIIRLRVLLGLCYFVLTVLLYYSLFKLFKLFRINNPTFNFKFIQIFAKMMLLIFGVKLVYFNKNELNSHKTGQCSYIYALNHASFFDYLIIYSIIPVFFQAIAYHSFFEFPFFGFIIKEIGSLPAIRTVVKETIEQNLDELAAGLNKGSLLIFPEGKLTQDGSLLPFRHGVGEIAIRSKRPVVPIIIQGSYALLPRPKHKMVGKQIWFFSYALFWLGSIFVNFRYRTVNIYVRPPLRVNEGENADSFTGRLREEFVSVLGS